jgi:hypothetical protein
MKPNPVVGSPRLRNREEGPVTDPGSSEYVSVPTTEMMTLEVGYFPSTGKISSSKYNASLLWSKEAAALSTYRAGDSMPFDCMLAVCKNA